MQKLATSLLTLSLVACGGGGGGGSDSNLSADCTPTNIVPGYIEWIGSANGSFVVDSDDEGMLFRASDGVLEFNGFVYFDIYVDTFSDFYDDLDGDGFYNYSGGSVYDVVATNGCTITGAISDSGFYFDVDEISPGVIMITESTKAAVFARPAPDAAARGDNGRTAKQGAVQERKVFGTYKGVAIDG